VVALAFQTLIIAKNALCRKKTETVALRLSTWVLQKLTYSTKERNMDLRKDKIFAENYRQGCKKFIKLHAVLV